MTQYYTDFSEYADTAALSVDWDEDRWHPDTLSLVSDATVTGGKHLRLSGSNNRRFCSFDAINGDASRDDVEILSRIRLPAAGNANGYGVGFRGSGDSSSETAYFARSRFNKVNVANYKNGNFANISDGIGNALSNNIWYWFRFRANGSSIKFKNWSGAVGDEPATWDLETTDTNISGVGWVGLHLFNSGNYDCDVFAVGTGGDVAPTAPITSTAPTLSAVSATNITATSITPNVTLADAAAGAIFWAVYPSGQTNPSAADIKAETVANGDGYGSDTSPTVDTTNFQGATIPGLTAGTSYKLAAVWDDGTDTSAVAVSGVFSTLAIVEASITVGAKAGISASSTAQALAAITAAIKAGYQATATSVFEASISTATKAGTTTAAQAQAESFSTHPALAGTSATGQVDAVGTIEAAVSVAAKMGISASAEAIAGGAVTVAAAHSLIASGGTSIEASITAGTKSGIGASENMVTDQSITAGTKAGATTSAQAAAQAQITLSTATATQILATALAEAGIAYSTLHNVTIGGSSVSGDAVTPDGRIVRVTAELRTFTVDSENRTTLH